MRFSQVEYHKSNDFFVRVISVVDEGDADVNFPSDIPFTVGGSIDINGFDRSKEWRGFEI